MNQWTFLNDDFVLSQDARLHYSDLAIQRGYGVFDIFKVVQGSPLFLEEHLNRFFYSAQEMHLSPTRSKEELKSIIAELILKNAITNSGIRLTLTGGYSANGMDIGRPNLLISQQHFQPLTPEQIIAGTHLVTYEHQRQLPQAKTIDYLMAVWLRPYVQQNGANDVLYHTKGIISECPRSNFFIVTQEDHLITPKENILKGITRNKLLALAATQFKVEERNIRLEEMFEAREAFITSTTKTILPVCAINKRPIGEGTTGRITSQLLELWQAHVQQPFLKQIGDTL